MLRITRASCRYKPSVHVACKKDHPRRNGSVMKKNPMKPDSIDDSSASNGERIQNEGARTMNRREMNAALLAGAALAAMPIAARAQAVKTLPAPRREAGKPLMQALQLRRSIRAFSPRPLPQQLLSDVLWAAYGVNRPSGDRTAPYWRHIMVIDVYAAMADGVWLYDPKQHALRPHLDTDIRAQTGLQDFVATAPLNLVYVAHGERMKEITPEERRLYSSVDAAFAGQNVYLYCASEGLATVFRGAVDQEKLGRAMQLDDGQFVTFAQTVGYPVAS
jgi:nitroreductase